MKKGKFSFDIEPQFVDFRQNVKISYLVDLILTASGLNADENSFGIRDLNKIGATWVLSRFALEMDYLPKQYEKISIETWVEEVHALNTIRNYRVFDEKGAVIGNATSVWVMINLKTRRPMELKLLVGITDFALFEESRIERPLKIDAVEGDPIDEFKAKYSDIDINQHVNSVRYIDWMLNTFTLDEHKSIRIKRIDVNFMSEVLWGDQIQIFKDEQEPDDLRFEIKANERTAFRGRVLRSVAP